ncbi:polyserase-2 isoform X9 [Mus musculus]|uniref:polyserase-2 isoform X9 n=1 Tax=Mus musculus TaxID=10090 RepID=UPI0011AE28D4|nr:polyserase-2 isoform X9 [Mus musculus]
MRSVATILIPDNYSTVELGADLALLRLASPAKLGPSVRPVCLPRASHLFAHGTACWATGWGDVQEAVPLPLPWVLQEVELRLLGEAACQCLYSRPGPFNLTFQLLPGMLCAGYPAGRRDTCQGDSGGPLVCEDGGRWFLAGITSFGFGCGRRNRPGVFTAVAPYESWIREHVMGSEPGPVFPSQLQKPQSGPWEPREENCTFAQPECGKAPRPGTWPWEAQVTVPGSTPCYGALVSDRWVLAPASCFLDSPHDFETWRVLLPSRPEEERVARLVAHENASRDFASDLALLQLRTRVNLTAAPSAVCLPHHEHYFLPGSHCRLARWGRGGARGRAGPRTGWDGRSGTHAGGRIDPSLLISLPELAPGSSAQLEAQLLNGWWCHCLYGRQGETVPRPGDPPHLLCPAYQEEEEAGLCWVSSRNSLQKSRPDQDPAGDSSWSLLCREEGTWFLAGYRTLSDGCLRPRAFSPMQTHVPVVAAVSILTPRLCHCLYPGILTPGTFCVLYSEGQEDRCEVTSAPPLLCQTEEGPWVLVGMAVRGNRELFAAIGPEATWISQTVGEAHFLHLGGSSYWSPEGSDLCPQDLAGSASSPKVTALLLLLLLAPLIPR